VNENDMPEVSANSMSYVNPPMPASTSPLASALVAARYQFPTIQRSRTVSVRTRQGGSYTFSYAPLDVILKAVTPHLSIHGISILQDVEWNADMTRGVVTTILVHSSGDMVTLSPFPVIVPEGASPQEIGSLLTYARRNSVCTALCIAAEEDEDGNIASGNHARVTREVASTEQPAQGADPEITLKINSCKTIEELGELWKSLSADQRNAGNAATKDIRKNQLLTSGV
jgi:hypothetical protein